MSDCMRTFLVNLPLTFVTYLIVVYLWGRSEGLDWPITLFRGAVIAIAVATGTTLTLSRKQCER